MIDSILKLMRKDRAAADGLEIFSGLLLSSTAAKSLEGLDQAALARFASLSFNNLLHKPPKGHSIFFETTDLLSHGGPPGTILGIINDDMPFVLESVIAALHAQGLIPRLVFHPIFKVRRNSAGQLQAVAGSGDRNWASGDQESYITAVLDPLDADRQLHLRQALDVVLDDVRSAAVDSDALRNRMQQAISDYDGTQLGLSPARGAPGPFELKEASQFLRWLGQANFTLLGAREFDAVGLDESYELLPASATALGIARTSGDGAGSPRIAAPVMAPRVRQLYDGPQPLIFYKARETSRVRQRVPFDCIGVKRYSSSGRLTGELRLYGLFTPASFMQPVGSIPIIRQKVKRVLERAQFPPESHNGRTLTDILENFPRDELLQIDEELLLDWSLKLLDLNIRPRPAVLARRDDLGRHTSALAFVPRDHYSSDVRARIGAYLEEQLGGKVIAFYPYISASPLVRVQIVLAGERSEPIDEHSLDTGISEIVRTWDERLVEAVSRTADHGSAAKAATYRTAFSAGYRDQFTIERAVEDIARIERLGPQMPVAIDFYRPPNASPRRLRAAIYRFDDPIPLSERVPVLENMGFKVIDERSYRVRPQPLGKPREVVLHDMELETADGSVLDVVTHEARMEETFLAVFRGEAENDLFNALVIKAELDWREAAIMRAFAAFMRQMRAPFGPRYIAETLVRHSQIARDLQAIFRARFELPGAATQEAREAIVTELRQRIESALGDVRLLDEDRILRRLMNVMLAVVRTNVFRRDALGQPSPTMAFKLASREIERLPEPKPFREIFVYSPRVEGVHLRFAPIARGGIRWSDRPQDYRTEILGLAKAQQVKNAVIVPSGAKGGFVPKHLKHDAPREEMQTEGIACYRLFIEALLSLTDNICDGTLTTPEGVIPRDGDDPYLVVAADKGTATFSDHSNAISTARGFWLGDAFASGGSAGYDHKRMGITARGAWECVKRHFREIDIDIQRQPVRVIGVGDMSGDVFGNAMLLSAELRLVAAFDHRDIFIDPDPDPAIGLAERKRLFELPRSSWADYDRTRISAGGGVFSRSAKSIRLSQQIRSLLALETTETTPAELIQALLRCETDLLWFGGIGTYVRETGENDEQVGDRANDALRITAVELRAKVIGEGANLGMTQRARIEAAKRGIRLNADFIDNSAGVNTSDQEVNIKIALEPAMAAGRLSRDERNTLLAGMSTEVAVSVLANNHAQGLALSLAERSSQRDLAPFVGLIRHLEERGLIDRRLESLPLGAELTERTQQRKGLTRPELAILLSWAKIALSAELLTSQLPDGPEAAGLHHYFPRALNDGYQPEIAAHRLRREIVTTRLTNTIINCGGPEVMIRLASQKSEPAPMIAEAYLAVREIFDIDRAWKELDELDGRISASLQLDLYEGLKDLCERETLALLATRNDTPVRQLLSAYAPIATELRTDIAALLPPRRREELEAKQRALIEKGVPAAVAARHAALPILAQTVSLAVRTSRSGSGARETAQSLLVAEEHLRIAELRERIGLLPPADKFDRQVISRSQAVIEAAVRSIAQAMLKDGAARAMPIDQWAGLHAPTLAEARTAIDEALTDPGFSMARLGVIADAMRGFASSHA